MGSRLVLEGITVWRLRFDRKRMHATGEFLGKNAINHAMTFDRPLADEGPRHQLHCKVRFYRLRRARMSGGWMPYMTGVTM